MAQVFFVSHINPGKGSWPVKIKRTKFRRKSIGQKYGKYFNLIMNENKMAA